MSHKVIYQDKYVCITSDRVCINTLFLDKEQIRFVDVVGQAYPIGRNILLVGGWFSLFIYLITLIFGGWLFFLVIAVVELVIGYGCFKRKYALRIGYGMGVTKALITPEQEYLLKVKQQIEQVLL